MKNFELITLRELAIELANLDWSFDRSISSLLNEARTKEVTFFEEREHFDGNHSYEDVWHTISYHHPTGLVVIRENSDRHGRHIHGDNYRSRAFYYVLKNRL